MDLTCLDPRLLPGWDHGAACQTLSSVTSIPAIVINICVALSPGPGLSTIEEDTHQVSLL
ncbi:unnamed protein product, partial [Natator depressus]